MAGRRRRWFLFSCPGLPGPAARTGAVALAVLVALAVFAVFASACSDAVLHPLILPPDGGAITGTGGGGCVACTDFPAQPILAPVDDTMPLPSNLPARFGTPGAGTAGAGPCVIEPQMGSLFPENWLRPRFRWKALPPTTVVEIRLHVDVERHDLVVYTNAASWTMSAAMWLALSHNIPDHPITVSVRSLDLTSDAAVAGLGTQGTIMIAPVDAPGTIVYWAIKGVTSLNGFQIGDESVVTVIKPVRGRCVGCHSSTPDGEFVAFSDADTPDGQFASVALGSARSGAPPPTTLITPAASALLARRNQHLSSFSPAHWRPGDRMVLSLLNLRIIWTDLETTSQAEETGWGNLAVDGDPGPAWGGPSFSHDGKFVVYASGQGSNNGGLLSRADLFRVDYNNHHGGTATRIAGASDKAWNEFYPVLSPDDALIAYTRAGVNQGDSYNNANAEVFVVASGGGAPTRVVANDPCPCLGTTSPGVTNSWPKWAPDSSFAGGKTYYWLTFSSTRGETGRPQLYVTPVLRVDELGGVVTYPALYLWNQPPTEGNHTPAWDRFKIPPVP